MSITKKVFTWYTFEFKWVRGIHGRYLINTYSMNSTITHCNRKYNQTYFWYFFFLSTSRLEALPIDSNMSFDGSSYCGRNSKHHKLETIRKGSINYKAIKELEIIPWILRSHQLKCTSDMVFIVIKFHNFFDYNQTPNFIN